MKIGIGMSSGVGSLGGGKWDGIGQLAEKLRAFPNVTTFVNRIPHDRFNWAQRVHEQASALTIENDFDVIGLIAHSKGAEYEAEVAVDIKAFGRKVDWVYFSDGWDKCGRLFIVENVRYLESWTQDRYRPRGVPIILASNSTEWIKHAPLTNVKHRDMSALTAFHDAVVAAVRRAA